MEVKYLILIVHSFILVGLNQCRSEKGAKKISVIGTAMVYKHHAGIETEDGRRYYLQGIDDWGAKYKGKKVKVTGKLITLPPPVIKNPNPAIKASVQPKVRDGEYLKNAKWRLIK
jgi:hypothetical protein